MKVDKFLNITTKTKNLYLAPKIILRQGISQILIPHNKYEDIKEDHIDLVGLQIDHKCLTMAARFHTSRFFTPKPPSFLAKQIVFQATFALP
jgi:hypothetical protein